MADTRKRGLASTGLKFRMTNVRDMTRVPNIQLASLESKIVGKCMKRLEERAKSMEESKQSTNASVTVRTSQQSVMDRNKRESSLNKSNQTLYDLFGRERRDSFREENPITFRKAVEVSANDISLHNSELSPSSRWIHECQKVFFDNIERAKNLDFTGSISTLARPEDQGYSTQRYQPRKRPNRDILRIISQNKKVDKESIQKVEVMLTNRNCKYLLLLRESKSR